MEAAPSLEHDLSSHIAELEADPHAPIDEKLFDSCLSFLAVQLVQEQQKLILLIVRLSGLLLKLQQDPSPVIRLLSKLIEPLTFTDVLALDPPVNFVGGLDAGALPYNLLVLKILKKSTSNVQDAAILAGMPDVVRALVELWLSTSDMGVAETASNVLLDLLKIDREKSSVQVHGVGDDELQSGGQGLIWRRLFGDKDIYSLLYALPSFNSSEEDGLNKREKSISQARLMSFLPRVGVLDWDYVVRSHHEDVENKYGLEAKQGLLHFTALHLVDYKNDVLLHMNLLQFFTELISTVRIPSQSHSDQSVALEFLIDHHLHERAMAHWLHPDDPSHDPVDQTFLYGPAAQYTSAFASNYPTTFVSGDLLKPVLQRLARATDVTANQWAHGESPKHDLNVLSSVPRTALLPQSFLGTGRQASPLLTIPCKVTNEDALHTLGAVFHGARPPLPSGSLQDDEESQAARLLFQLYFHYHDTLFADLVTHADTVALPAKALAAIVCLSAIISARWSTLPSSNTSTATSNASATNTQDAAPTTESTSLPTESQLQSHTLPNPFPRHLLSVGPSPHPLDTLLRPPARDRILPYLLSPPRQFANLVGGRGDTESSAYKIAVAKWECLGTFRRALDEWQPEGGIGEALGLPGVRAAVGRRVAEGVWGVSSEVGGRIATMEL